MIGLTAFILTHFNRQGIVTRALDSALKVVGADRGFVRLAGPGGSGDDEDAGASFVSLTAGGESPTPDQFGAAAGLVEEACRRRDAIVRGRSLAIPLLLDARENPPQDRRAGVPDPDRGLLGALYLERAAAAPPFDEEATADLTSAAGSFAALIACMLVALETHTDRLSGLLTRSFFFKLLPHEIRTAGEAGHPLALLMLDVRRLETVNRLSGRARGDHLLRLLAALLRGGIRENDFAARTGGDEFLAALPGCDEAAALAIASRLRDQFQPQSRGAGLPDITFNAGVAVFPEHGAHAIELLHRADQALSAAKKLGPGRTLAWREEHRWVRERVDRLQDFLMGDPAEDYSRILTLLDSVAEANSPLESAEMLRRLLDRMIDATGAERALLLRHGADAATEVMLTRDRARMDVESSKLRYSRRIVEQALLSGHPHCSAWTTEDPSRSYRALRLRTALAVPLVAPHGITGVVYLDSREEASRYTVPTMAYLGALAHQASQVMERARLVEELDRRQREIEVLHRRLRSAAPAPRNAVETREIDPPRTVVFPESGPMRAVLETARAAAASDSPVLLTGETGAGKEIVAREIHRLSRRASGPFVAVNCAAMPHGLIESEMFGHARGAFTGADRERRGLFEEADMGTLFLDEIAATDVAFQVKLLRALQESVVRRVGETTDRPVDVRVIAAANVDLEDAMRRGEFRDDLYYRLAVFTLRVPPLRERSDEIPSLCARFLEEACRRTGRPAPRIDGEALALLQGHSWPGNVRQLRNAVERLAALCAGPTIGASEAREVMGEGSARPGGRAAAAPAPGLSPAAVRAVELLEEMASTGRSFWEVGRDRFLARELTRDHLRALVALGLSRTGSYKRTAELFNIAPSDHKRFLDFLHNHDLRPRQGVMERGSEK